MRISQGNGRRNGPEISNGSQHEGGFALTHEKVAITSPGGGLRDVGARHAERDGYVEAHFREKKQREHSNARIDRRFLCLLLFTFFGYR
jgi:hypothetical protein